MPRAKPEQEFLRRTMARAFNDAWDLLDKPRRSGRDNRRMLDLAHAARYHSSVIGTARNHAIGDWQVSRVYAAIGEPRLALEYAESCLGICEAARISDLLSTAYEAVARAYAVGNRPKLARSYLEKARRQLARADLDKDDRDLYLSQVEDTEKLIRRSVSPRRAKRRTP